MSERPSVGFRKADKLRLLPLPSDAFADFSLTGIGAIENLHEPVALSFPDSSAPDVASRLFFRAGNLSTTLLSTEMAFDIYASLEAMTGGSQIQ